MHSSSSVVQLKLIHSFSCTLAPVVCTQNYCMVDDTIGEITCYATLLTIKCNLLFQQLDKKVIMFILIL